MTQEILENKIKYHQYLYYTKSAPKITDADFDTLWDKLEKDYPDSEVLKQVGKDHTEGFPTGRHLMMMGSQRKCTEISEIQDWIRLNSITAPIVIEEKLDGLSLELQYESGELISAVTRGDGFIGDIVTENAKKIPSIPEKLKSKDFTGAVRGEVVLFWSVFKSKYAEEYKNPRNTASGFLKNLEGTNCSDLTFIAYDKTISSDRLETEIIMWLSQNGFILPNLKQVYHKPTNEALESIIKEFAKNRSSLEYGIDGLVLKQNSLDKDDRDEARPKKQIAFKFPPEEKTTTLLDVEWHMSNSTLTPVAILKPVDLDGSTVQRASLANMKLIKDMNLKIGDKVVVVKRGDIIPKIERIAFSLGGKNIKGPETCPSCGKTLLEDSSTRIYCGNRECPSVIAGNIMRWIDILDIKGFGIALVEDLCEKEFVKEPADFYTMNRTDYLLTTNLKKATQKAFKALDSVTELETEKIVAGMNMDGFGEKQATKLVENGFNTFEKMKNIKQSEMTAIEGFGDKTFNSFNTEFNIAYPKIKNLLDTGKIKIKETKVTLLDGISGKSFCFTGKLETLKRKDAEATVKSFGGKITGVTDKLDYLVCNDPNSSSSKLKKAKDIGTIIISEKEFTEMFK